MKFIRLQSIASLLQHDLNTISNDLFSIGKISSEVNFYITDNHDQYETWQEMENKEMFSYGILKNTSFTDGNLFLSGLLEESFILNVKCYRNQRDDIEEIFNSYSISKLKNSKFRYENLTINMIPGKVSFNNFAFSGDGRNEEMFIATFTFKFEYFENRLITDDIQLKIDGILVPILSVDFKNDKSEIANLAYSKSNQDYKMINEIFAINFPITENEKANEIIVSALSNKFNDKYTIEWAFGDVFTKTVDYTIRSGRVSYNEHSRAIGVEVVFQMATPRVLIEIDGVSIPVLSYQIAQSRAITPINAPDLEVVSLVENYSYSIQISFVHDDSAKSQELLNEAISKIIDTEHHIFYRDESGNEFEYEVLTKDSTYSFTEIPNIVYSITFVGRKV